MSREALILDGDGIAWSERTLALGEEELRLVRGRGDVWRCCRCGERFGDEDWEEEREVPVILFVGEGEECEECDLCLGCFQGLLSAGVLEVRHGGVDGGGESEAT